MIYSGLIISLQIQAVTAELDELIARVISDQKKRMKEAESLTINIFSTSSGEGKSTTGLNGYFVYFQLLTDCLLRMKSSDADKNELISLCTKEYEGNRSQLTILREFQRDYSASKVLWWYTRDSFFYKILNKALRVQNIEVLFLFRSFISDIHQQLQYYQSKSSLCVYRSQLMAGDEVNSLKQNIGQFISVNSFLSSSIQRETALFFVGDGTATGGLERVLFEIVADPNVVSTKPFANISSLSGFPSESEVLFMLGSIFRLNNISGSDGQLWIIQMTLCGDNEHDLQQVLSDMKDQNGSAETDLYTLAKILLDMGKFDLAEKYYLCSMKEIPLDNSLLIKYYEDLGKIASHKGDLDMRIEWHKKAVDLISRTSLSNDANNDVLTNFTGKFIGRK
jgi:tetratricopeptide (TPR) repeat protein